MARGEIHFYDSLAPLQRVMLGDSLMAASAAGQHIEQVEIVFTAELTSKKVIAAWLETVAQTEALQMAFRIVNGNPVGWEKAPAREISIQEVLPVSWERWLAADRSREILIPQQVPWRVVYWPEARHFLWTFHHALLDGRSMTRILQNFLKRIAGEPAEFLAIAPWHNHSLHEAAMAVNAFQETLLRLEPAGMKFSTESADGGKAVCFLGHEVLTALEAIALEIKVTVATILIWAWGQAVIERSATQATMVEQVRCGIPQPGMAGFTMNILPVLVHRAVDGEVEKPLQELRAQLLGLRAIEQVSWIEHADGLSVIMIEYGTLEHILRGGVGGNRIESVMLHECEGVSLAATAHLLPDLRLEVEGPSKFDLLGRWIAFLELVQKTMTQEKI